LSISGKLSLEYFLRPTRVSLERVVQQTILSVLTESLVSLFAVCDRCGSNDTC